MMIKLECASLDPIKHPIRTTMDTGMIKSKSISLVIVWAINPLIEFVNINKLAEATACLGLARPEEEHLMERLLMQF